MNHALGLGLGLGPVVSPPNENGPTQGLRKTLTGVSHKVRREQAVGTEDVNLTAMNVYEYMYSVSRAAVI